MCECVCGVCVRCVGVRVCGCVCGVRDVRCVWRMVYVSVYAVCGWCGCGVCECECECVCARVCARVCRGVMEGEGAGETETESMLAQVQERVPLTNQLIRAPPNIVGVRRVPVMGQCVMEWDPVVCIGRCMCVDV